MGLSGIDAESDSDRAAEFMDLLAARQSQIYGYIFDSRNRTLWSRLQILDIRVSILLKALFNTITGNCFILNIIFDLHFFEFIQSLN